MTWQPGQLVRTEQDRREWETWRRERKRQQQRERRALYRRFDYYPSPEAAKTIGALCEHRTGCDLSSVINRIVIEWAERSAPE